MENETKKIALGNVLVFFSVAVLGIIFLGFIFDHFSMRYLKRIQGSTSNLYYFNELSYFIASLTIFTFQALFLYRQYRSFYILTFFDTKFNVQYALRIIILSTLLLGGLKALVKYVSTRFNYNMYINGIRKVILTDVLLSLLIHSVNLENPKEEIININEDEKELVLDVRNEFILNRRYRSNSACDLGFEQKRVVIKEFLNLVPTSLGSIPTIIADIKRKAKYKAGKIDKNIKKSHKQFFIKDIKGFFKRANVFEYLISQLNIDPNLRLDRKKITEFYDKYYRDLIMTSKNLEQINSAIDKIYFATQILICFLTGIIIFISSNGQIGFISGCISTILGTQVVSKILSDNVMQSIIFLFVIHPFDIGDRILININGVIENLIVAELNVFSTSFFKWDGTFFFIPNTVLIGIPISNIRRSNSIMESHLVQVGSKVSPEKLQKLKELLRRFCMEKKELFTDYILVNYDKIEDSNKVLIRVSMQYQTNYQHYESYLHKRSIFISELSRCLRELKISYKLPVQKVKMVK